MQPVAQCTFGEEVADSSGIPHRRFMNINIGSKTCSPKKVLG